MSKIDPKHSDRSDSIKLVLNSHPSIFIRYGNIIILSILILLLGCVIYLPYSEEIPIDITFRAHKISNTLVGKFQIPYAPASTIQKGKNVLLVSQNDSLYSTIIDVRDTVNINYTNKLIYFRVNNRKLINYSYNLSLDNPLRYVITIRYSKFINKFLIPK